MSPRVWSPELRAVQDEDWFVRPAGWLAGLLSSLCCELPVGANQPFFTIYGQNSVCCVHSWFEPKGRRKQARTFCIFNEYTHTQELAHRRDPRFHMGPVSSSKCLVQVHSSRGGCFLETLQTDLNGCQRAQSDSPNWRAERLYFVHTYLSCITIYSETLVRVQIRALYVSGSLVPCSSNLPVCVVACSPRN